MKKIEPQRHRILTDGELFRVETRAAGSAEWACEEKRCDCRFLIYEAIEFKRVRDAEKYIHEKYGSSAIIESRTWRPI
jgi:hypothetical protein